MARPPVVHGHPDAELRDSARYPDGYQALFWLPTQIASPIVFGEWLGVALMAVSGWLVFAIVREHTPWRPAAWIAAALFLALVEIHRFYGGFPRAFVHPVVLLVVLLAIRRRNLARWSRPRSVLLPDGRAARDRRVGRLSAAARSPAVGGTAADGSRARAGRHGGVALGPARRRRRAGGVHGVRGARLRGVRGRRALGFFVPSMIDYLARTAAASACAVREHPAIAAGALLVARPANLRLLRPEVLALPVVALVGCAAAHAVLFQLYLPHRFTYPLVAFFAIAVGVCCGRLDGLGRPRPRLRAFLMLAAPLAVFAFAVYVFPLGPTEQPASLDRGAAAAGGLVLAGAVALVLRRPPAQRAGARGGGQRARVGVAMRAPPKWARGTLCPTPAAAGTSRACQGRGDRGRPDGPQVHPGDDPPPGRHLDAARSRLRDGVLPSRARADVRDAASLLRPVGGRDRRARRALRRDAPVGRPGAVRKVVAPAAPAGASASPYGRFIGSCWSGEPAALNLPAACRRWRNESSEVYDIRCIADRARS